VRSGFAMEFSRLSFPPQSAGVSDKTKRLLVLLLLLFGDEDGMGVMLITMAMTLLLDGNEHWRYRQTIDAGFVLFVQRLESLDRQARSTQQKTIVAAGGREG